MLAALHSPRRRVCAHVRLLAWHSRGVVTGHHGLVVSSTLPVGLSSARTSPSCGPCGGAALASPQCRWYNTPRPEPAALDAMVTHPPPLTLSTEIPTALIRIVALMSPAQYKRLVGALSELPRDRYVVDGHEFGTVCQFLLCFFCSLGVLPT